MKKRDVIMYLAIAAILALMLLIPTKGYCQFHQPKRKLLIFKDYTVKADSVLISEIAKLHYSGCIVDSVSCFAHSSKDFDLVPRVTGVPSRFVKVRAVSVSEYRRVIIYYRKELMIGE